MNKKTIKGSKRGVTFSDRALFPIHSKIKYTIDHKRKRLLIALSEKEGQSINWEEKLELASEEKAYLDQVREASVSRKSTGKEYIPLIDIRSKEVLNLFDGYEQLHVTIGEEIVIVTCSDDGESVLERIRGLLRKKKQRKTYVFPKKEFYDVVGVNESESTSDQILHVASFFSGAGLLDSSFIDSGYEIVFALEKNAEAARTYRYNHGDHIVVGDVCDLDTYTSLMQDAEVVIGGPPCVGFSAANRKTNFLLNPNNLLVRKYIDAIKAIKGAKVFVLENVPQLLNTMFAKEICSELSDFDISYGVLNSADFGAPQERKRAIFIGSKIGRIQLPTPTHKKENYKTVREAFRGLHDGIPNQTDYTIPKPETVERMQHIKEGENWEAIPESLRGSMRHGKTHSSVFRRLFWDKPSITMTNVRKSNILHPSENRILSIREVARLFGLPDDFEFKGTLSSIQQQAANGVPYQLGKAIADQIKQAFKRYSPYGMA